MGVNSKKHQKECVVLRNIMLCTKYDTLCGSSLRMEKTGTDMEKKECVKEVEGLRIAVLRGASTTSLFKVLHFPNWKSILLVVSSSPDIPSEAHRRKWNNLRGDTSVLTTHKFPNKPTGRSDIRLL
jgi:hypothetical protein